MHGAQGKISGKSRLTIGRKSGDTRGMPVEFPVHRMRRTSSAETPEVEAARTDAVFLSHSRTDRQAFIVARAGLEQAGPAVFRGKDEIRVGERWTTGLKAALQARFAFVLLVGRDGVRRRVGANLEVSRSASCRAQQASGLVTV